MNFAFTTALLLIFLLPGAVYRKFYFIRQFSKQYHKSTFIELVFAGFLNSLLLHSLWVGVVSLFGYRVDFHTIGMLLMSKDYPEPAFDNLSKNIDLIVYYNSSLLVFSGALGLCLHYLIRWRPIRLDRRLKMFRFQNYWHYILFGEFFDFPRAEITLREDTPKDIELIHVDALVETKNESMVYQGILVDYELTKEGGLDCIYLKGVKRNPLDSLKNDISKRELARDTFRVPGHVMIIPYASIKNLNITYYKTFQVLNSDGKLVFFEVSKVE